MIASQIPTADEHLSWITNHGGPVVRWENHNHYSRSVIGEGLEGWWHDKPQDGIQRTGRLSKHIETAYGVLMLEVFASSATALNSLPLRWNSVLMVGEGRYVRRAGAARTFAEALAAAEASQHERRSIGGLTWWQEDGDRWVSWLGPYTLEAIRLAIALVDQQPWHFRIMGQAQSFEEAAMLAALGRVQGGANA